MTKLVGKIEDSNLQINVKMLAAGPKGEKGEKGEKGDKGDKGNKPAHQWSNTSLRFENPDGTWGSYVNLKGDKGDKGDKGEKGDKGDPGEVTQAEFDAHKADYATYKDSNNLKVAKVEKELNDYKATMQQVNINQEPKQKVSGYGTVSLPKNAANGQVSVGVKGLTATNIVKNGNFFNGVAGWEASSSTLTANSNILTVAGNGAGSYVTAYQNTEIVGTLNKKIFYRAMVRVTNANCKNIALRVQNISGGSPYGVKVQTSPTQDTWYLLYAVYTFTSEVPRIRFRIDHDYADAATANGKIMEVQNVMAIELVGEDLSLTVDQLNAKYSNYFDGTKSTISGSRLKSVGKNLFDKISAIQDKYVKRSNGLIGNSVGYYASDFISVKPNTTYIFTNFVVTGLAGAVSYDVNKNFIADLSPNGNRTVTTPSNAAFIRFSILSGNIDTAQFELGTLATPYEPYTESTQYITAKDDEGKIVELRSLPNGTKDEVRVSEGKLIKRVSDDVDIKESTFTLHSSSGRYINIDVYAVALNNFLGGKAKLVNVNGQQAMIYATTPYGFTDDINLFEFVPFTDNRVFVKVPKGENPTTYFTSNPATLTYQLAEPVEVPIEVSGTLLSNPSGTVYVEPVVADAGVYTDKIEILHQDLPIKALEKLSKVDFMTGVETELDIGGIVIAENKLSFTHPELQDGDIVFFEYEYDREGTTPETEIEYYDSRYTIKDSVTDKFYKWNVTVADGVPSIELVEV